MILGAMKCGTTSLAHILSTHKDIGFSKPKETDFFVDYPNWRDKIKKYHSFFPKEEKKLYGEGSTCYTKFPRFSLSLWEDIYEYNSEMKFIYIMRHPVDRLVSHYMHLYEMGYEETSISEAFTTKASLINVSRYFMQIKPYIDKFGKENVLLLDFDEFVSNSQHEMDKVSEFLGIDKKGYAIKDFSKVHANKSVGGPQKKHNRFYQPKGFLKLIKNYSPLLWNKITDNSKRSFIQKIQIPCELRKAIIHSVKTDVLEIEKIMEKDLKKWLV